MLKISAVYLIGKAEIPIHYTTWAEVEQALLKQVSGFISSTYISHLTKALHQNLEAINSSILLNSLFFKEKGSNKHGFDTPNRLYQIYLSHIHRPSWFSRKRFRYVSGFSKHACHQKSPKRTFSIWLTSRPPRSHGCKYRMRPETVLHNYLKCS